MKTREYNAMFTVYGLGDMSKKDVKRLLKWIRNLANDIEKDGAGAYTMGRYRARLMQDDSKE